MRNLRIGVFTTVLVVAATVLSMPSLCAADWGCTSCAAPVAMAPIAVAPSYATYMPANMPTSAYRAFYRPAVVAAYQPVTAYYGSPYTSYAVTTYRPFWGGWSYQARMVPYTTYQPVYTATPVIAYTGCGTCVTSNSPYDTCNPCVSGGCNTMSYAAPASGCASCATPATVVSPAPYNGNSPTAPPTGAAPQKTFEEKVQKPATEPDLKPIPQTDTRLNSMPAPLLPDPGDRTASRSVRISARVASPQASLVRYNDGWQPAHD